jgi:L-asparaginase II
MSGVRSEQFAPIAVVSRNGVDESIHFGALVALNADGTVAFSVGDSNVTIFPRSATKPFQALAMVRAGLSLPLEQLALVCSSHNGEDVHQKTALAILAGAGLTENTLANTAGHSWHAQTAHEAIRMNQPKSSLPMDCSGKHAGMLATCVLNGWDVNTYLEQSHPLQRAITDVITELTGAAPIAIGTDGCGAPAHVVSLVGLARAARSIAVGEAGDSGDNIFNAMSQYPYMVGGDTRDVTKIVSAIPGLFAKDGAESVYIAAMNDGRAVALKISDGSRRAAPTVLLAALRRLGIDTSHVPEDIAELTYGHGKPVGGVRAIGIEG